MCWACEGGLRVSLVSMGAAVDGAGASGLHWRPCAQSFIQRPLAATPTPPLLLPALEQSSV